MALNFIVCCDQNDGIGRDGTMPWHFKLDMKWFRETTAGHIVIMGRKTWDSIGSPLSSRHNIIITHDIVFPESTITNSPKDLIQNRYLTLIANSTSIAINQVELIRKNNNHNLKVFVIGGTAIFKLFLLNTIKTLDTLFLTKINGNFNCDVKFPIELLNMEKTYDETIEDKNTLDGKIYKLRFMKFIIDRTKETKSQAYKSLE